MLEYAMPTVYPAIIAPHAAGTTPHGNLIWTRMASTTGWTSAYLVLGVLTGKIESNFKIYYLSSLSSFHPIPATLLRPRQSVSPWCRRLLKLIFLYKYYFILIFFCIKNFLKCITKGKINNMPAFDKVMISHRTAGFCNGFPCFRNSFVTSRI